MSVPGTVVTLTARGTQAVQPTVATWMLKANDDVVSTWMRMLRAQVSGSRCSLALCVLSVTHRSRTRPAERPGVQASREAWSHRQSPHPGHVGQAPGVLRCLVRVAYGAGENVCRTLALSPRLVWASNDCLTRGCARFRAGPQDEPVQTGVRRVDRGLSIQDGAYTGPRSPVHLCACVVVYEYEPPPALTLLRGGPVLFARPAFQVVCACSATSSTLRTLHPCSSTRGE